VQNYKNNPILLLSWDISQSTRLGCVIYDKDLAEGKLSLFHSTHTGFGSPLSFCHLHVVARLRICGVIPPILLHGTIFK
jgi:hypothetical protein